MITKLHLHYAFKYNCQGPVWDCSNIFGTRGDIRWSEERISKGNGWDCQDSQICLWRAKDVLDGQFEKSVSGNKAFPNICIILTPKMHLEYYKISY